MRRFSFLSIVAALAASGCINVAERSDLAQVSSDIVANGDTPGADPGTAELPGDPGAIDLGVDPGTDPGVLDLGPADLGPADLGPTDPGEGPDLFDPGFDPGPTNCGNGQCEAGLGETTKTCPADCCKCGDGICDGSCAETIETCCQDCSGCGDGKVAPCENPSSCPEDTCGSCGDGKCMGFKCKEPEWCPQDCAGACGNQVCEKGVENIDNCPVDCDPEACGDGDCTPGDGGPEGCPEDCGKGCGDAKCEGGETWENCPIDCGFCGDGYCVLNRGETHGNCPEDCKG